MQTKIEIPEGYEIDQTNSTFELIKFRKIESKYPTRISDVKGRNFYLDSHGCLSKSKTYSKDKNQMFTEKDCEEHLAFIQVDMLCQAWNKIDGFENVSKTFKYGIYNSRDELRVEDLVKSNITIAFKTKETAELFLSTFRELLETCKRLL